MYVHHFKPVSVLLIKENGQVYLNNILDNKLLFPVASWETGPLQRYRLASKTANTSAGDTSSGARGRDNQREGYMVRT